MNAETCGRIRLLMSCVVFSASTVLTGCAAPPVQYYPDAEQAIEDEVGSAPPPGSAVVEFTTNSVAIAVFQRRVGDQAV